MFSRKCSHYFINGCWWKDVSRHTNAPTCSLQTGKKSIPYHVTSFANWFRSEATNTGITICHSTRAIGGETLWGINNLTMDNCDECGNDLSTNNSRFSLHEHPNGKMANVHFAVTFRRYRMDFQDMILWQMCHSLYSPGPDAERYPTDLFSCVSINGFFFAVCSII